MSATLNSNRFIIILYENWKWYIKIENDLKRYESFERDEVPSWKTSKLSIHFLNWTETKLELSYEYKYICALMHNCADALTIILGFLEMLNFQFLELIEVRIKGQIPGMTWSWDYKRINFLEKKGPIFAYI